MKTIEELTFDELVEWAEGEVLKELIKGKFHNAIWMVCNTAAQWHEAQSKKKKE
jgi:hypothetical protein